MRQAILAVAICCIASAPVDLFGESAGQIDRAGENLLAAESLWHSAAMLANAPPETPARAHRLVTVAQFAERLAPDDPRTHRLLASIYEVQGKLAPAAESLRICLDHKRQDHAIGVRWLITKLSTLNDSDQRMEFLQSVIDQHELPSSLRAEAAAQSASVFARQGKKDLQLKALRHAMVLAEDHPAALRGVFSLQEDRSTLRRTEMLLGELRGNPMAYRTAWDLANLLSGLGSYHESAKMFFYTMTVFGRRNPSQDPPSQLVAEYFSSMLDAGQAKDAVEKFQPMLTTFPDHPNLQSLMVEALRATGENEKADDIVRSMEVAYTSKRTVAAERGSVDLELAWFYLVTKPQPAIALGHARKAAQSIDDPVAQRILGAAELVSGEAASGEQRLRKLITQDTYAAAFLAEHYISQNDTDSAREVILAAAKGPHGGPAFRKLAAIAQAHDIQIPPAEGKDQVAQPFATFDGRYMDMALNPQKYLSVEIRPVSPQVQPGDPIEIMAVLRNKGPIAVPVGDWGLISPVMAIEVKLSGPEGTAFHDVPLAVFPAPRHLPAGKSVITKVRLDVGLLAGFLTVLPLEELELTVSGMLDPIQSDAKIRSAVRGVGIEPATITRTSLLGQFDRSSPANWQQAYQLSLGYIVRDLKRGSMPARMSAARKIASLLAMVARVESGKLKLPTELSETVERPVLLSMLRAMLKDPSPSVRAEMLVNLGHVPLDGSIIMLLGGTIGDPSPLVRMRVAELLGATRDVAHLPVLKHLAGDKDPLVSQMAAVFLPTE